ncbi:hypothetical protein Ahy_B04g072626 [Arachis hypogaea]|uniref:RNase H type-1 domain-containing protein n=1 Tax=Arachis hypogaea TaxID=3818 RepID=A0A444ZNF0_ARAHY|nr:hypothetical protein Ahy_B04g072626 [Arachis hypogaea]
MAISSIWYERNKLVFYEANSQPVKVVEEIKSRCREYTKVMKKQGLARKMTKKPDNLIRWYPPDADYLKINVDGSFYAHNGNAACGGVVRDNLGKFLKGFACNLGSCSIMHAELWGIIKGLQIAIDNGYNRIVIESDSMMAIGFIKVDCPRHHPCSPLLDDIKVLRRRLTQVSWKHILHEANGVADILARIGQNLPIGHQIFYFPPSEIVHSLYVDSIGTLRLRGF